jgi:hypothetical protein
MMPKLPLSAAMMAVLAIFVAGCAGPPLQPGASREEVLARYGTPSRVVPLVSGTRLQYSRQPAGQSAVMVDLDAAGSVVLEREALNPAGFSRIAVGQWTRDDIEREFGRPASIDHVASWTGDILTYRWLDGSIDMYFWVYLDPRQVVQRVGQGMEIKPKGADD